MKKKLRKWSTYPFVFKQEELREITEDIKNPGRGWYQIHTFSLQDLISWEQVQTTIWEEDAIVLLRIDIGAYQNELIPENALDVMDDILTYFEEQNKDIILRCAYDFEGKGMEREPGLFSQVEKHLEQLAPILMKHEESIFLYQGILVGNWGEMHSSKFLTNDYICRTMKILESITNGKIFLGVRKPAFWRLLFTEEECEEAMSNKKIGLYNDGILGSDTDLGTFGTMQKRLAGWENSWEREEEIAFIQKLCRYVPNGGEVVAREDGRQYPLTDAANILKQMKITYLNRVYDETVLTYWSKLKWDKADVWNGMNGTDYLGRHLGYRFCLRGVEPHLEKDTFLLQIEIENVGFANCYQDMNVVLSYEGVDINDEQEIECDVKRWDCDTIIKISHRLQLKAGAYYLSMKRRRDGKIVYFANESDEKGRVLIGQLMKS